MPVKNGILLPLEEDAKQFNMPVKNGILLPLEKKSKQSNMPVKNRILPILEEDAKQSNMPAKNGILLPLQEDANRSMPVMNQISSVPEVSAEPTFDLRDHPPVCPTCKERFSFRYQLEWHFQWKHGSGGRLFLCNECNDTFPSEVTLRLHRISHGNIVRHTCEKCNLRFDTDLELRKHHLSHTRLQIPYMCEKCLKSFSDRLSLKRHQDSHVEEVTTKRLSCNGCFSRKSFNLKHSKSRVIQSQFGKSIHEKCYTYRTYKSL